MSTLDHTDGKACEAASVTICFADVARPFKDLQAIVLLNQVQGGTVMSRRSQAYMQAVQPTFHTALHHYVSYREAFALGKSVFRLARRDREPWTHL